MTTQQANEITVKSVISATDGEYQKIMKQIAESAAKGSFQTDTYELCELVQCRLIQDGYKITHHPGDFRDQRERSYYTINWKYS